MTHKQKIFEVRTKLIDTIDERKCVQHDDVDYTHSGHRPLRIDVGASVDPPLYHHYQQQLTRAAKGAAKREPLEVKAPAALGAAELRKANRAILFSRILYEEIKNKEKVDSTREEMKVFTDGAFFMHRSILQTLVTHVGTFAVFGSTCKVPRVKPNFPAVSGGGKTDPLKASQPSLLTALIPVNY
jgi:hypothetical protein